MSKRHFDDQDSGENSFKAKYNPAKLYTEQTCSQNNKWKFEYYFGNVDKETRKNIQLDDVAMFSVTKSDQADEITDLLLSYMPPFATICDGTACAGGNTISFVRPGKFAFIDSFEIDRGRFECLNNNIKQCGVESRVSTHNDDFVSFIDRMDYYDIIFADPPWGGEDYDRHSNLHMYMNNQDVGDIFYKLNKHCHYFVLKAPSNFDSKDFARRSQMTQIYDRNFVISQKKHTYWKLFVYVTNSTYLGQYFHCFPPAHYHDKSTKPPYDLSKELNRLHIPKEELQNTSCFQLSCQYTKYIHSFLTLQQHHSMRSFCAALFNCRDYRFKLVEANAFSGAVTATLAQVSPPFEEMCCCHVTPSFSKVLELYKVNVETIYAHEQSIECVSMTSSKFLQDSIIFMDYSSELLQRDLTTNQPISSTILCRSTSKRQRYVLYKYVTSLFLDVNTSVPLVVLAVPKGYEEVLLKHCLFGAVDVEALVHDECRSSLHYPGEVSLVSLFKGYPCVSSNLQFYYFYTNYKNGRGKITRTVNLLGQASREYLDLLLREIDATMLKGEEDYRRSRSASSSYAPPIRLHDYLRSPDRCYCCELYRSIASYLFPGGHNTDDALFRNLYDASSSYVAEHPSALALPFSILGSYLDAMFIVEKCLGDLEAPKRIVCVGSTYGHIAVELAQKYGLPKEEVLVLGRFDARLTEEPCYRFERYESGALPLADQSCDLVVGTCLHEYLNQEELATEIWRVLSPRGRFVLIDHHTLYNTDRLYNDVVHRLYRDVLIRTYNETQLRLHPSLQQRLKKEDLLVPPPRHASHRCPCKEAGPYRTNYQWDAVFRVAHFSRVVSPELDSLFSVGNIMDNLQRLFWAVYRRN